MEQLICIIIASIEIIEYFSILAPAAVSSVFLIILLILLLPDHHHVMPKVPVQEDGVKRQLFVDGTASHELASHGVRADADTDAYMVKTHKFNQTNEIFGDACRTACVFISLAFMRGFLMVSHTKREQFLVDWVKDGLARSVMAMLLEGSQCAENYIEVVVPEHQAVWGRQHADAYALPDELKYELFDGSLASQHKACFDGIKDFFSTIDMNMLVLGSNENTLKIAVATMLQDLKASQSKQGKPSAYMLVCLGKASTVLTCGHPGCYCLHWDSHVYRPDRSDCSASLLFQSAKAFLAHMCNAGLYQEKAPCTLYAFRLSDVDKHVSGTCPLCTEQASSFPGWSVLKSHVHMCGTDPNKGNPVPASPPSPAAPASPPSPVPFCGIAGTADMIDLEILEAAAEPASPKCPVPVHAAMPASPKCPVPVELEAAGQTTHALVQASPSTSLATPIKPSGWQKLKAHASSLQTPEKIEKCMPDKKRALAVSGQSAHVCSKRSRKSTDKHDQQLAKERRKLATKGKAMASQLGIDFQGQFQPVHNHVVAKGHWEAFHIKLAEGKVSPSDLGCEGCMLVMEDVAVAYNTLVSQMEEGDDVPISKPLTASRLTFVQRLEHLKELEGMVGLRCGRKPNELNSQTNAVPLWQDMHRWLHLRRPGQYTFLGSGKSELHCHLCNVKFAAFRTNNIFFVLQHEASELHHGQSLPQKAHQCHGVALDGKSCALPCWEFRQSFQKWLDHGCPWHFASQHQCYMDVVPVIKAFTCKGNAFRPVNGGKFCNSCLHLASSRDFCEKVATWHYRIDLSELVLATALDDRMEQNRLLGSMASSPYIGQSQIVIDVPALKDGTYLQRRTLLRKQVLCISRQSMNQAARQFINNRLQCLPNMSHGKSMSQVIVRQADALVANRTVKNDVDLCKLILEGALQADDVCRTLVSALVHKADRLKRGCQRVGASHLPGIDDASLHEVGFAIASALGQSDLLQLFGLNPRGMPKAWAGQCMLANFTIYCV